jgi:tyramine---L-glutamate ligase
MRVFIFEYVTGGGMWEAPRESPTDSSLLVEAWAMLQAVVTDFSLLAGVKVWTTRDVRLPTRHALPCQKTLISSSAAELQALAQLSAAADWTLLIAPESGGALARRCAVVAAAGGRLLSPSSEMIELASNKHATCEFLAKRGVSVASGVRLASGGLQIPDNLRFPLILKPLDGCGSQGVRLISNKSEFPQEIDRPLRCEEFVPGQAASVAVLCGPTGNYPLPACEQRLSRDGRFTYQGGRLPLDATLDRRARRLAETAIAALPQPRGYIGVDLVLGDSEDGSGDRVIEVNPRLTTSYVGLRAAAKANLAAAMLTVAEGASPDLCFGDEPLEFMADGTVSYPSSAG